MITRVIPYFPELSKTVGVKSGVLLAHLMNWTVKAPEAHQGWVHRTRTQMIEETGLSRYELEPARKRLVKAGFVIEVLKGCPARLWYRVDIEAVKQVTGDDPTPTSVVYEGVSV